MDVGFTRNPLVRRLSGLIAVVAILLAVELVSLPHHSFIFAAIEDASHAPLFGIVTIGVLLILSDGYSHSWRKKYILTFGVVFLLAVSSEYVQGLAARDASIQDVLADVLGCLSTLCFFLTMDKAIDVKIKPKIREFRLRIRSFAFVLLLPVLVPLFLLASDYARRDCCFPSLLCSDGMYGKTKFISTFNASWTAAQGRQTCQPDTAWQSGELTMNPADYSGLILLEPVPNWSSYSRLRLNLFFPGDTSIVMELKIEDSSKMADEYYNRFNGAFRIQPGLNEVLVPLSEIRNLPRGRILDLTNVRKLCLFSSQLKDTMNLYVEEIRLE